MRRLLAAALLLGLLATACDGIAKPRATPTLPPATATSPSRASRFDIAREVEADNDPSLPGEYVDLPAIYGGYYGNNDGVNTAAHFRQPIDYSPQGLPPAGGPHWGSGACNVLPSVSPPYCGPVPWGIYRQPWPTESLVHNMEHAGVIIWYHTSDGALIDALESFATRQLSSGVLLVLVPYPEMDDETVAITVWSRRDKFPASEYDPERLQRFIDGLYCRFDPEGFCEPAPAQPRETPHPGQLL